MLVSAWGGLWAARRVAWDPERVPRPVLALLRGMTFAGWIATLAGWYVTEVGRQPWIAYGLVRTSEVASTVPWSHIAVTLAMYVTLYVVLIVCYVTVLRHMAGKPVKEGPVTPQSGMAMADVAEVVSGSFNKRGFLR
jgi:cytochrome d ubiquinol oxidase subunit I